MRTTALTALIVATALVGPSPAGELVLKVKPTEAEKTPWVSTVRASGAISLAVSDAFGWLAVGSAVDKIGRVSLFKLGAEGKPVGEPVVALLPRPAHFTKDRPNNPIAVAFHPSLPLLYVWQETNNPGPEPSPTDPALKDFDHLLVYAIDGAIPDLLVALCRGPMFHTGGVAGSIVVSLELGRLYVPNLRHFSKQLDGSGIGWYHLDGDGLPILTDEEPGKAPAPITYDPRQYAANRTARVAALRAAVAASKPVGAFRFTPPDTYGLHYFPCGVGILPISRDVFLAGGPFGLVTYNGANRAGRALAFLLPVSFVTYYCTRASFHPTLPLVYTTMAGYQNVYRIEHVDGYVTLAPQVVRFESGTLRTYPIIMPKRSAVAIGGAGAVYITGIDAEGRFKDEEAVQINVATPSVEAMGYSEKYDRLYVPIEAKP